MADTERTKAELLIIFGDGQSAGSINEQDMRDYVVTTDIVNTRFSTGLITGGEVTISPGDNTKVDIAAGTGFYADNTTDPLNPVRLKVSWPNFDLVNLPDLAIQPATFFGLDLSSGTAVVVRRAQLFNAEERRDFVVLAPAVHPGGIQIDSVAATYGFALDERQTLGDLADAVGSINLKGGNVYSASSADDLTMDKSAGGTFSLGLNYHNSKKSPNTTTDPAFSPVPFLLYTYQDGSGGFTFSPPSTVVDPFQYDNNGTLTEVPNGNPFTIQRILSLSLINLTVIHYGQTPYSTLAAAESAINTELFNKNPALESGFRTWLIIRKNVEKMITDAADVRFIAAGMFGDVLRS